MKSDVCIHPVTEAEREWVCAFFREQWGADTVAGHGTVYKGADLPGFYAEIEGVRFGLITYHVEGDACEIVSIDSLCEGIGIGTALIEAVKDVVRAHGCKRMWLITTNDNLNALRFYQKRGFELVKIHRNAVEVSRKLKPEIPNTGAYGIPIRHEIELELFL